MRGFFVSNVIRKKLLSAPHGGVKGTHVITEEVTLDESGITKDAETFCRGHFTLWMHEQNGVRVNVRRIGHEFQDWVQVGIQPKQKVLLLTCHSSGFGLFKFN